MGNYRLNNYHRSPFKYRNVTGQSGELYGVELEMEHENSREALIDSIPDQRYERLRPVTERDGSLDNTGVEIIFPPMKVSQLSRKDGFFRRTLLALKEGGAKTSYATGMHVNVNTHGWGTNLVDAFVLFHQILPDSLVNSIGGRNRNHYCGNLWYERYEPLRYVGHRASGNHTTIASIRRGRVELRYPAASLNPERLMMVISFSRLLKKYLQEEVLPKVSQNPTIEEVLGKRPNSYALEKFYNYVRSHNTPDAKRVKGVLPDAKRSRKAAKSAVVRRTRAA